MPADVRDDAEVRGAVAACGGRLDALVLAAGVLGPGSPIDEIDDAGWQASLDVNLTGAMRCIRAAAPLLRASPRGRVVGIASTGALVGLPRLAAYTAAKAGLVGLLRSAAADLAPVTVNAVCPGSVPGPMLDASAAVYGLGSASELAAHHLLGRLLQPGEVASLVAYLCSEAAGGITGAVLPVDAGFTAR